MAVFACPTALSMRRYLAELALLEDGDPHAHEQRKAEDLEARLAAIEQSHSSRILNAVSRIRG